MKDKNNQPKKMQTISFNEPEKSVAEKVILEKIEEAKTEKIASSIRIETQSAAVSSHIGMNETIDPDMHGFTFEGLKLVKENPTLAIIANECNRFQYTIRV